MLAIKTDLKIRSPKLPVSIRISLIVWQGKVPGVQMVTLTHGLFKYPAEVFTEHSEPFTVMSRTLAALLDGTVRVVAPAMPPKAAVIVVVPADTDVAIPCEPATLLMVAADGADELQVTSVVKSCITLFEYVPVAVNCCVVPAREEMPGLAGVTVMATSVAGVTVSKVESDMLPNPALIMDVPVVDPDVTRPCEPAALLIVATDGADELQVTAVVKSCTILPGYVPSAVNCCEVEMAILELDGVTAIEVKVGLGLPGEAPVDPPPPPHPAINTKTRKKRSTLFNFIDGHSLRDQSRNIGPALQVPHMPPFFDNDVSCLHSYASPACFVLSLPKNFLIFPRIGA